MIKLIVVPGILLFSIGAIAQKVPQTISAVSVSYILSDDKMTRENNIADVKAEDILLKAIEAYGGEKLIASLKDIQLNGTVDIMGQSLEYSQKNVFPNGFATAVSMGGSPIMKQSKIDTTYDLQIPGGAGGNDIDDAAKEEIDMRSAFFTERFMLSNPKYIYTVKGTEQVDGKDAYVINVISPKGSESTLFYDVVSGLKLQDKRVSSSPMGGEMTITTKFADYQSFEGIKVPTKLSIDLGELKQDILIKEVKVNQGLQLSDL
ncbi:MAG: hypothetical protein V4717_02405 [Bacteroidota bacterium]